MKVITKTTLALVTVSSKSDISDLTKYERTKARL